MAPETRTYAVDVAAKARRQLKKIAKKDRQSYPEIEAGIDSLAHWPNISRVRALTRHRYGYCLRIGRYRVLFDVHSTVRIITVQEVKQRDEHTY